MIRFSLKDISTLLNHYKNESIAARSRSHSQALDTMSNHDVARAREQIAPGVVDHLRLVQKLRDYRYRLQ